MAKTSYSHLFLAWEKEKNFKYLNEWESEKKQKLLSQEDKEMLGRLFFFRSQQSQDIQSIERDYFHAKNLLFNNPKEWENIYQKALLQGKYHNSLPLLRLSFEMAEASEGPLKKSTPPELLQHLAEAYYQFGKRSYDLSVLEKALQALHRQQSLNSLTSLEKALIDWKMAECFFLMGEKSGEVVDFFQALKLFSKAAYFYDNEWEFCLLQGICYDRIYQLINAKDYLYQAKECFEKAFYSKHQDPMTSLRLVQTLVALYEIDAYDSHYQRALEIINSLLPHLPQKGDFYQQRGKLKLFKGSFHGEAEEVEKALEDFILAEEEGIDRQKTHYDKIEAFIFLGSQKESLDLLKKVECFLERDHFLQAGEYKGTIARVRYLLCLGNYFEEASYFHEAIGCLNEYKGQENGEIFHLFALAYYELYLANQSIGHLAKARIFAQKALRLGLNHVLYWGLFGSILSKIGEIEDDYELLKEANQQFKKALDIRGDLCYQDLPWLCDYGFNLHLLSDYYQQEEELERVIETFQLILEIEPDHLDARYHLAQALLNLGSMNGEIETLNRAVEEYRYLVKEDAEDTLALNDLGEAYITLSQLQKESLPGGTSEDSLRQAEEVLLQAISLGSSEAFYNLACLFSLKEAYQQTLFYLQKALSVDCLPPVEEILEDEWLAGFRKCKLFKLFFSQLTES